MGAFWDSMAEKYDVKTDIVYVSANRRVVEATKKYCNKEKCLLDIGCGTGTFSIKLAEYVKEIDGVDSSEKMLNIAKGKTGQANITNIHWECRDIMNARLPEKRYDIVTAFNLLLYIRDPEKLIANIHNSLRDQGLFISVTDCLGEKISLLKKIVLALSKFGFLPFVHQFTMQSLSDLIKSMGFEIIDSDNFHSSPPNFYIIAKKK